MVQLRVSHQNKSSVVRNLSPFVKIEGNRIRFLYSKHFRCDLGGHHSQRTASAIYMKPHAFMPSDFCDPLQVIYSTDVHGTRRANDAKGGESSRSVGGDCFL